ncbi:uncharacterized protein LOC115879754 [Sitophilus oryzae]|uniref:Uncharacterized protein LOC115879754 n=1 Tax=Sitophilus oryzae TaxID=7048 RepID=A0A6J2XM42_SITOR|nr:uncharacterized protein LOC115879754 [Sitophilus oryzae]
MAKNDENAVNCAINAILEETNKMFEKGKSEMEQNLKRLTEQTKIQIDNIVQELDRNCQEIKKHEKDAKTEINKMVKAYTETLKNAENDATKTLNESWGIARNAMEKTFDAVKGQLGNRATDLESSLKQLIKYSEKIISDCIKMLHGFVNNAEKQIKTIADQHIKSIKN